MISKANLKKNNLEFRVDYFIITTSDNFWAEYLLLVLLPVRVFFGLSITQSFTYVHVLVKKEKVSLMGANFKSKQIFLVFPLSTVELGHLNFL